LQQPVLVHEKPVGCQPVALHADAAAVAEFLLSGIASDRADGAFIHLDDDIRMAEEIVVIPPGYPEAL
jgi:hypothetical protein